MVGRSDHFENARKERSTASPVTKIAFAVVKHSQPDRMLAFCVQKRICIRVKATDTYR